MKTPPTADRHARSTPPGTVLASLVAAALLAAGCSGSDDPVTEPVVLGPVESGDTGGGDTVDPPPEDDPVVRETLTGQADVPGLSVRFAGDADVASLSSPWLAFVDVYQNAPLPTETGELTVELVRYTPELAFERHVEFYTPTLDDCFIRPPRTEGDGGEEEEDVDDGKRLVNGGDAVTLSSAGGEWLRVPYSREEALYEYDGDAGGFPATIPADLTLSIPGAEFPAIEALPIGRLDPPQRLSPAIDEPVTPDTEYRWVPADDGSVPRIVFKNFVDGAFEGFPVSCRMVDDGAFELPEDVLAALAALPGETTVRYTRDLNRLEFRDGIAVFRSLEIVDD